MERLLSSTARTFADETPVFEAKRVNDWYERNFLLRNINDVPPEAVQGNKVLGFNGSYFFECEFDEGFWCNIGGEDMTHWTKLPELPEAI
tara:strand:+ start:71 stop:340 length:270 start_codon:yes stop_codon:yes gene_type:complete